MLISPYRNTITVGIFYALPAFQLVLAEQRVSMIIIEGGETYDDPSHVRFSTPVVIRICATTTLSVPILLEFSVPSTTSGATLVMFY